MIVGYNPKVYIKEFLQDLKEFAEENEIDIEYVCTDEQHDYFDIIHKNIVLFKIELWDITNYDNNMYQEMKISWSNISPLLTLIMNSNRIKIINMGSDYMTFIVNDDVIE